MRPVNKGDAPRVYAKYEDAKQDLANVLGSFCSYCERRLSSNLAVEHILPKDDNLGFSHLKTVWTNFLLSCVNCNSTKSNKLIQFDQCLLPDRDNTFHVFIYYESGLIEIRNDIDQEYVVMAEELLQLVGLDKTPLTSEDPKVLFSAIERFSQRKEAWGLAKVIRNDYENGKVLIKHICYLATANGFFSIWMTAFDGFPEVRKELINAFAGTSEECFHPTTTASISPRPQVAGLQNSGKI